MIDSSLGEPYARYAAVARFMLDTLSIKCLDSSFDVYVRDMTNTSWDGPAAGGGRCCLSLCFCTWCFFSHFSALTQVVTFTRDKNGHRLCGVWKFPLLLEQHGVSFITERTQMRTTSSMWGCWWIKVVRVCSQGGSGSTRPAQNLDSTRVLIHPTSRSPASLLCAYSKHHLFS